MARVLRAGDGRRLELQGRVATELVGGNDAEGNLTVRVVEVAPEGPVARPLHIHEGVSEFVYVLAGHGELHDKDGGTTRVGPGEAVHIPGGERHKIAPSGPEPLRLLCAFATGDLAAHTTEASGKEPS